MKSYFKEPINCFDLFQLTSTACIVLVNMVDSDSSYKQEQRFVATFSVFFLWLKFFDWLRLFETTSFYVKLVAATFQDIGTFMILFFAGLAMVGSSLYMM